MFLPCYPTTHVWFRQPGQLSAYPSQSSCRFCSTSLSCHHIRYHLAAAADELVSTNYELRSATSMASVRFIVAIASCFD